MKWLHPVVKKRHFVSEWQASIDALDEAFALGFAEGPRHVPLPSMDTTPHSKSLRTCSFADIVEVAFGLNDEFQTFSTSIPHESLRNWKEKPWKLRPIAQKSRARRSLHGSGLALADHGPDDLSFMEHLISDKPVAPAAAWRRFGDEVEAPRLTRAFPEEDPIQRHINDPTFLPSWWNQLRSMHERLGQVECLEEGKVIYVSSWYLHGHTRQRSPVSRTLRLGPDWSDWLELIKEVWQDQLRREQPVDIGLVMPHPPSTVFQSHVAHLILCQEVHPEVASVGIVSAYFRHSTRDAIVQQAHVLPLFINKMIAIDLTSTWTHCTTRQCHVRIGDLSLREDGHETPTPWCTSIVTEIFPVEDDFDDYSSFMAAGARSRTQPTSMPVMERAEAVQQEGDIDEEEPSSSDSETDLAWCQAAVFSVHGQPREGSVNIVHDVNGPLTRHNVARLAGFPRDELHAVHPVHVLPQDLAERGLRAFLAQHRNDLPAQSRLAFVLVDVEFHPAGPCRIYDRVRCPLYVPTVLSRHQILRALDVFLYAQFVGDTCLVWHNNELIHQDRGLYARIYHGDYLRIALPPPPEPLQNIPTRCIARLLQMGIETQDLAAFYWISDVDNDLDSMPTHHAVIEDVQSSEEMSPCSSSAGNSLLQLTTRLLNRGRVIEHHGCEDFAALRERYCAQHDTNVQGPVAPQLQAPLPDFEAELVPHWRAQATEGPGGMERVATVVSWYNDHHRNPLCAHPRVVQLFEDPFEWRALLTRAWIDLIDPAIDVHFFVVNPRPLYGAAEVAAHVILVQRPLADFKSVHVAVLDDAVQSGYPRQWALIMPNQLLLNMGLDIMGYGALCHAPSPAAVCSLWHGDRELVNADAFAIAHGMSLSLFVQRQPLQLMSGLTEGLNLLQTGVIRRKIQLERLVHHDEPDPCKVIKVVAGVHYMQLPAFIELPPTSDPKDVERELRHWGHDCSCVLFKDYDVAVCYPRAIPKGSRPAIHLYLQITTEFQVDFIVDRKVLADTTLEHMRFLYEHGHWRACIHGVMADEEFPAKLFRFYDNAVAEAPVHVERSPLPWPDRLPKLDALRPAFDSSRVTSCSTECRLELGLKAEDIEHFFQSAQDILCTTLEGIELPPHIAQALACCQPLDRIDRLLIYCDGSSLPEKRRCPPARAEEQGKGDTWAFLVLAEEYTDSSHPKLNFVGWTAQPVLFEEGARHHIGSASIGSETSEREALFWSSLWRLAQNHNLPTTFCTDCIAAERQGAGTDGAKDPSMPFRLLRANFQALESILSDQFLSTSHVKGHSGDVWNDLADHLAKQERIKSFYLPRQNLDMCKWQKLLPFFWWVLTQDRCLPLFHDGFFDVSPPALPPAQLPEPPPCVEDYKDVHFQLSFGSCNVASLYAGEHGNAGKVQLLRTQMTEFQFNFMGLQETRCPQICSLVDNVFRLGAGACKGHWGVELWLNFNQPIAYVDKTPHFLTQQDVIVVHQEPRILVAKIDHAIWKACLVVAHAPQSGQSLEERCKWWEHFTTTLHRFDEGSPIYVMLDANAAPGQADSKAVGLNGFAETKNTPLLRQFLDEFDLCLPATFACHQGPCDTWVSPQGDSAHCIDFVCVPSSQVRSCSMSRTVEEFELMNGDFDHRLVALQLDWHATHLWPRPVSTQTKNNGKINFNRPSISRQSVAKAIAKIPVPEWSTDIDTHFQHYNLDLLNSLSQCCPRPTRGPKKTFFTSELWTLRTKRVTAKKQLSAVRQRQRSELLLFIFKAWTLHREPEDHEWTADFFNYNTSLFCWKLKLHARLHAHAKAMRAQLRQTRSRALAEALRLLPDHAPANDILQTVKAHIGPTNLKHLKRKTLPMLQDEEGQPCETPAQLLGRWIQFFGDMEGGSRVVPGSLRDRTMGPC